MTKRPANQARGRLADQHGSGRPRLLQTRGQVHGLALRRVIHAQVVADVADDHRARC